MVYAQTDAAAYVNQEPVVAGIVDGQLAVWVGTPTATSPVTGGTGTTAATTTGATNGATAITTATAGGAGGPKTGAS
jgi:hypothetical protein